VIYLCIILQVDNTPPSVSRSGKPIDLFPSGPISLIGNNAPTLAAIMHRGVRLKKVITRRTQISPSVAASTLAQAFKVIVKPFHSYRFLSLGVPKDVLVQKLICKHKGLIPDLNVKACQPI